MVTMLPMPTPPTPFRPSAVLLRDPRRSPSATTEPAETAPPQRPYQPIGWLQPTTILPTLPFNLPTGSPCRLPALSRR